MSTYDNDAFREYTGQTTDDEEVVEIELDLTEIIPQAAAALYGATEGSEAGVASYAELDDDEREQYEAAVSVVLESALPEISEQLLKAVAE